jgi:hypothetical protein
MNIRLAIAKLLGIKPEIKIETQFVEKQVEVVRFVPAGAKPVPLYAFRKPGKYYAAETFGYTDNINLAMEWSNQHPYNYSSVISCWCLDGEYFIPAHSKKITLTAELPKED